MSVLSSAPGAHISQRCGICSIPQTTHQCIVILSEAPKARLERLYRKMKAVGIRTGE